MSKLKPCPFCGGEAELVSFAHFPSHVVVCVECGSTGKDCEYSYQAIEAWNTRAERTCKNASGKNWWAFECSKCGHFEPQGVPVYCPNCGAKVVEP